MRVGRASPLIVGLVGLGLAVVLVLRVLSAFDYDPTVFAAFGSDSTEITEYGESVLGREVKTRAALGHDGKYFFVLANDPWLLEPSENVLVIDRPLYRAQRMLYPVLAGGLGLFTPSLVVWSLIVVNILSMGLGTWVTATLARDMGASAWWGLAFALNLGFISEMNIDGAGVVAAAAAFASVLLYRRGKAGAAVVLLCLAALAREAMLIAAAGSSLWLWRRGDRGNALKALFMPGAAVGLWAIFLRLRLGWEAGVGQVQEIGLPFQGFAESFEVWAEEPLDMVAGIAMIVLFVLYTRRAILADRLIGWAFLGFVPLGILFTRQVWVNYFDITRAVAPLITAFVFLAFVTQRSTTATAGDPELHPSRGRAR